MALWSYDHKWQVFGACLSLLVLCAWLASSLRVDNSFEAYFDHDDEVYSAYLKFRDDFGSDEVSFILYEVPDREYGPFDLRAMMQIAHLTNALQEEVPFVYQVSSLANAEIVEGDEGGLEIISWQRDFPEDQYALLAFRDELMSKTIYLDGFVSRDRRHGAIIIDMDRSSVDPIEDIRLNPNGGDELDNLYPQVSFDKIEEILKRSEYEGIRFWHSGDVALNSEMNRALKHDSQKLGAMSFILIALLLLILFQFRILGVLGPLLIVTCSVMCTVAFMAVMDWHWDMMAMMIPTMIFAIGVAASVHVLSEFWFYYEKSGNRREAIRETLYLVGPPCLLTSLTTAAGFMVMSISPIKAISHMGWAVPIGVIASFILSVTLLMFFLSFGKDNQRKSRHPFFRHGSEMASSGLLAIADFNIRHRVAVLSVSAGIFLLALLGITRLEVDSNYIEDFSDHMQIKTTTKYIDEVMGGTAGIVYLFDTGVKGGIKDPALLKEIERVQLEAAKHDYLAKKTWSIVDLLKDINKTFHGGDEKYYRIPESRELIAQLLLVYELSGGEELGEYVSTDYSRANLQIRCRNTKTSEFARFNDSMNEYLDNNPISHADMTMTGIGRLWLQLIEHITTSQIKGLMLAFVVISALMCFIFRSVKVGMLTMIPNMTPVFLTFGIMGWSGIDLDYTRLMIATIAIGIAVDDTIHMVTRFQHEYQRFGNYQTALRSTFESVGRALMITTIVLVLGFMVFVSSAMNGTMMFGLLMATTIFLALIGDFFLMPALMMTFKPFGPEFHVDTPRRSISEQVPAVSVAKSS